MRRLNQTVEANLFTSVFLARKLADAGLPSRGAALNQVDRGRSKARDSQVQ